LTFSLQKYPGEVLCMYTLPFYDLFISTIPRRGALYVPTHNLYLHFHFQMLKGQVKLCIYTVHAACSATYSSKIVF
jgi:hypothetical protein